MIEAFFSSLYSVAGAVLLACFVAYLAWRNGHKVRVAVAAATFRAAFGNAVLALAGNSDTSSTVVFQNHGCHLAAIDAFRPYVAWYRRRSFRRAVEGYAVQANIQRAKGPLEGLVFEGTPLAQHQRAELLASIESILKHAVAT